MRFCARVCDMGRCWECCHMCVHVCMRYVVCSALSVLMETDSPDPPLAQLEQSCFPGSLAHDLRRIP